MDTQTPLIHFVDDYAIRRDVCRDYRDQLAWCTAAFSRHLGRTATLGDLIPHSINSFLAVMKSDNLAGETRKSRRRMLLSLAADASRLRIIEPVHRDLVARVKAPRHIPDGISYDEARRVVQSIRRPSCPEHGRWLRYCYRSIGATRRQWWLAYLLASWDTGAPADLRTLRTVDVRSDGHVYTLRHKTGKPLHWHLSEATMTAINELIAAHRRDTVFPLPGRLDSFRREARHIITVIAGLQGKTLGGFRSGAGTDAELTHGAGAGSQLLGNTPQIFHQHYAIPEILQRDVKGPRPLQLS